MYCEGFMSPWEGGGGGNYGIGWKLKKEREPSNNEKYTITKQKL